MTRTIAIGTLVFGVTAAIAGYIWTPFEFPFVIVIPAVLGWYAVVRFGFDAARAPIAAVVGGVTFTVALLVAMFLALTDGSPLPLGPAAAAVLAATLAGAATGWVLARGYGSLVMAGTSAAGMGVATMVMGLLRSATPAAAQVAGPEQYAYFALAIGLVGAIVGASAGAGVHVLRQRADGPAGH